MSRAQRALASAADAAASGGGCYGKKNPREQHDAWQLGRLPPLSEAAATVRSRGPTGRASIRAADDVLEADLQSDEILACFEEALGERQPEMGTEAAAGREANAESAEAAPRLEAKATCIGEATASATHMFMRKCSLECRNTLGAAIHHASRLCRLPPHA